MGPSSETWQATTQATQSYSSCQTIHLPQSKPSSLHNHAQHSLQKWKLLTVAKQICRRQAVKCIHRLTVCIHSVSYTLKYLETERSSQSGWHTSNAWSSHLNTIWSIHLSSASAIINCAAHQKSSSLLDKGKSLADEAAEQAETSICVGPLMAAENCEPLTTFPSLIAAQTS